MKPRLIKPLVALLLTAASYESSAALFTSDTFRQNQTSTGQSFEFTINNAPLAALLDGSLFIRARGDYSEDSNIENMVVKVDETIGFASPWDGGSVITSYDPDVVEWSQEFVLNGADLVRWTSDQKIIITLALSEFVNHDLRANGQTALHPPYVEAYLTYNTAPVPLPATSLLFLSGLVGMLGYGRQRKPQ